MEETLNGVDTAQTEEESSSRWTLNRIVMLAAGVPIGLVILLFLIALGIVFFGDPEWWAIRMQYFRDLGLIVLTLNGILIVTGLAILVLQIARFVNLLSSEVKPMTDDARSTLAEVRATTAFVGKHTVQPFVRIQAFFVGALAFLRELLKLRRLAKPGSKKGDS
ncbi:MAG: hypothetical protein KC546_12530 [Anaerolineae bacterium]|nr:hypothetical protein [Anaerolineae bacterium]MCA9889195.1 hypothetical protein [Anaerolineae bacterium]